MAAPQTPVPDWAEHAVSLSILGGATFVLLCGAIVTLFLWTLKSHRDVLSERITEGFGLLSSSISDVANRFDRAFQDVWHELAEQRDRIEEVEKSCAAQHGQQNGRWTPRSGADRRKG